jgi:hypothetical protein
LIVFERIATLESKNAKEKGTRKKEEGLART